MTRLERLCSLRDQLAERLEQATSDHAFALMASQYRDTLAQVADLEAQQTAAAAVEVSPLERKRAERAARPSSTA